MIVVTGATGNVGRPLMDLLGDKAIGVSRPQVDLARPSTLEPAVAGAEALFLLFAGDLLGPDTNIADVLDVAKAGGVRRVVLLSSQGAGTRPGMVPHSRLAGFEEAVRQSSLEWTILRPNGFFTNTYAWVQPIREHGVAAAPFADVALPFIDPADIAAVAAVALEGGHEGRTYELTGPEAMTPRQRAEALSLATGRGIRFVEQSVEEAREQMLQFMPPPVVDGTLTVLGSPTAEEQQVSGHVGQVTGRAATRFADWAARNAKAF
ncbi:NAD(P)H-binding protein [Lentzea sp. PSKA42]|uniref:NAD(P)H-binding protein n=1 Tax=Lentzea indica TaxID=2604800 RepID=A0ABX1FNE3_9PSEU|nr:NAD(P)H-binding protein [Lentzea indica]NKE60435.1 NAD(P)H-binding protein [Lentzea indica]